MDFLDQEREAFKSREKPEPVAVDVDMGPSSEEEVVQVVDLGGQLSMTDFED